MKLSQRAGQAKAKSGRSAVRDPERELRLMEERQRWAELSGIPENAVKEVFEAILANSRRVQRER